MRKPMYEHVLYDVILKAVQGETEAVQYVLNHYGRYMSTLSQKSLYDNDGNMYTVVDEEIKKCLEIKLITALASFRVA